MKLERMIASDISELIRTERTCSRLANDAREKVIEAERAANKLEEFEQRRVASMWTCERIICEIELAEEFGIQIHLVSVEELKEDLMKWEENLRNLDRLIDDIKKQAA